MSLTDGVLVETVKEEDSKSEIHESLYGMEKSTGLPPIRRFINEDEDSIDDEPPPLRERKDDDDESSISPIHLIDPFIR